MLVRFYTFSKKVNSTAQPSLSAYSPDCLLKDETSILRPVIMLNIGGADIDPSLYNYCYIQKFARYYFIEDWTFNRGIWYAHCKCDPLATWKSEIGNSTQYILRSSDEYSGDIRDDLYPMTSQNTFYSRVGSTWWNISTTYGCFVVGMLANSGQSDITGGINYYAFTRDDYKNFMNVVFGINLNDSANQDLASAVRQQFSVTDAQAMALAYAAENPYTDYIDSIVWFPFSASVFGTRTNGLYVGRQYMSTVYYRLVDPKYNQLFSTAFSSIPKHPQASSRGNYLNAAPFSEYQIYLPRLGLTKIDASLLITYEKLTVTLQVDVVTGQGQYRIYIGDNADLKKHLIYTDFAPIGVSIKTAVTKEKGSVASAALQTMQAATSLNPFATIASIISLQREAQAPGSGRIGEAGGFLALTGDDNTLDGYVTLYSNHYYVAGEDVADNGRPLCLTRQISQIPGYIVCQHGDIAIPGTSEELKDIKAAMESGFFYE